MTSLQRLLASGQLVLRAEGYRTHGTGHHRTTILALPLVLGSEMTETADYLDACRSRRNTVDYDGIGVATEADVSELIAEAEMLGDVVHRWLAENHPQFS